VNLDQASRDVKSGYKKNILICLPILSDGAHRTDSRKYSNKLFAHRALQAKVGTLSLEAQTKLEKDTAEKRRKQMAKADAAMRRRLVRITLRRCVSSC